MIKGLERFRDHFSAYADNFVLIGGVAAMQWLEEADMRPRATKDFDLVLFVEDIDDQFLGHFWQFVKDGGYDNLRKNTGERVYYRFTAPKEDYPTMLEIFSRAPATLELRGSPEIIPIPAGEDASSLSAILMDDDYYGVVRDNKRMREGLPLLSPEGLILLKAKAFLDLNNRRREGDHVDEKHIKKHRNDVFKLSLLLAPDQQLTIPRSVHSDLQEFLDTFPENNSEWGSIRQASGLNPRQMDPSRILEVLTAGFQPA
ncbi:MAG: hypothetical protein KF886_23535 [Candidatus Hydrogenedentes bacterium]|nr:hypothetical protein [Candidatus Hydrogenedentota bacterium]